MISNICKIENGTRDLDAILKESKKVAIYNDLNEKQTLQLRLICEELDGMLPNIVDNFNGDFWIEFDNGECRVNVNMSFSEFTVEKKNELINVAKNKKNANAVGIVGKIRSAIENLFLDKENFQAYDMARLFNAGVEYSVGFSPVYNWSLNKYKSVVKEENAQDWDELEKSIIANLADDVIVGVKGKQASIVVVKKFK
ncbi:MAG: hypothetical protein J6U92_06545 [Clostridia bacterium]|nr:hypothetical protein [Clostridia bacterium]